MHVVYITGLGDNRAYGQKLAVRLWRLYSVESHFFQSRWASSETYAAKERRLMRLIDKLHAKGERVGLFAVSAGASLALNIYARHPDNICGVVLVAGKILNPETVSPKLRQHNPSFGVSVDTVASSIKSLNSRQLGFVLSVYSGRDRRVPMHDSQLEGTQWHHVRRGNHYHTIMHEITIGAWRNLEFLKKALYRE